MNAKRQDAPRAHDVADRAAASKVVSLEEQKFNEIAEWHLLSALIRGKPADVIDECDPNLFYREAHHVIADRVLWLREHGQDPSEMVTLVDDLIDCGKLEDAGGKLYVTNLWEWWPTPTEARHALGIVQRDFYRRRADETRHKWANAVAQYLEPADVARLAAECEYWEELARGLGTVLRPTHFRFLSVEELDDMQAARGLVGDILYEDTIAYLYGPSGRWKSFIALDWALSVAAGVLWLGKATQRQRVIYVAAEGAAGIRKRIRAWKTRHPGADLSLFHLVPQPVNLMGGEQVRAFRDDIQARGEPPGLIVFDTLARSMAGGDENATKDANTVTDSLGTIKAAFGCCVLCVHHTGKDVGRGLRGSSAIFANADTVILVNGKEGEARIEPGETIKLVSEKPKDAEPFEDIILTTEKVNWSLDEYGDVCESSLVVVGVGGAYSAGRPQPPKLSPTTRTALVALSASPGGMRANEWMRACQTSGVKSGTFKTWSKPELLRLRYVVEIDGTFKVTDDGQAILAGEPPTGRVVPFRPA